MNPYSGDFSIIPWNFLVVAGIFAAMVACSENNTNQNSTNDTRMQLALSERIILAQEAADSRLKVEVVVDGDTANPIPLTGLMIDNNTKTLTSDTRITLTAGDHELELIYYLDDPDFKLVRIVETDILTVKVTVDTTSEADFTAVQFRYLDNDHDGFLDATEIYKRTNPSDPESMPLPDKPVGVILTTGSSNIKIEWAAVEGASTYTLFWNTSNNVDSSSFRIDNVTSPFNHTSLTNGTEYFYRVMASNTAGGNSDLSDVVSAIPQPDSPTTTGSWDASQWDNTQWGN